MSQRHTVLKPIVRNLTAVIAAGLTTATATLFTSVFGIPGTLIGGVLTAMLTTASSAIYTAYLSSMVGIVLLADRPAPPPLGTLEDRPMPPPLGPSTDRPAPPPLEPTSRARRSPRRIRVLAAFEWFTSRTSPERRRSILYRGLQAGVVAYVIGIGIVTVVEFNFGTLSCVIWKVGCLVGYNPPSILYPFYR